MGRLATALDIRFDALPDDALTPVPLSNLAQPNRYIASRFEASPAAMIIGAASNQAAWCFAVEANLKGTGA